MGVLSALSRQLGAVLCPPRERQGFGLDQGERLSFRLRFSHALASEGARNSRSFSLLQLGANFDRFRYHLLTLSSGVACWWGVVIVEPMPPSEFLAFAKDAKRNRVKPSPAEVVANAGTTHCLEVIAAQVRQSLHQDHAFIACGSQPAQIASPRDVGSCALCATPPYPTPSSGGNLRSCVRSTASRRSGAESPRL